MKPYKPSQIVPAGGLLLLILSAVVGGALIGGIVSLVSNLIYLILFFPAAMGLAGGVLVALAIRRGKIRNPVVGQMGGLLAGLIIYSSMWFGNYLQFQNSVRSEILARSPGAAVAEVDAFVDQFIKNQTGVSGFSGYILLVDQDGVSIGRVGRSNSVNLGPTFSWVYWGAELFIILALSVSPAGRYARQPFCEACGRWYGTPALVGTLGASRSKELQAWVEGGQFQKLGEELQTNPALPNVGVFLATCGEGCADGETYLAVRLQSRNSKGAPDFKELQSGLITPPQAQDLRRGIEARKALYGI